MNKPTEKMIDVAARIIYEAHPLLETDPEDGSSWYVTFDDIKDSYPATYEDLCERVTTLTAALAVEAGADTRSLAVEIVDMIHGCTMEYSSQPAAHADEYDRVEEHLNSALTTSPASSGVEWIEWRGGDFLPVPPELRVTVLLRDGSTEGPAQAREFGGDESCWKHRGTGGDIVAYTYQPVECPTCNGTGKEGRHSICRDCDEAPASSGVEGAATTATELDVSLALYELITLAKSDGIRSVTDPTYTDRLFTEERAYRLILSAFTTSPASSDILPDRLYMLADNWKGRSDTPVGDEIRRRCATELLKELSRGSSPASSAVEGEDIQSYFERQIDWSRKTFGPALRTGGAIEHDRSKDASPAPHQEGRADADPV